MKYGAVLGLLLHLPEALFSQSAVFSRADTLRGTLLPERSCYDVNFYDLHLTVDPGTTAIEGFNNMRFTAVTEFSRMQFDLAAQMEVRKILFRGQSVAYRREYNAIHCVLPAAVPAGAAETVTIFFAGKPVVARNPPWDGGFIWKEDGKGAPWVTVACEGAGASLWWPLKDHLSDEPDSMAISVTVPSGLFCISNGILRSSLPLGNGQTRFDWFVSYPVNSYNVTLNLGDYGHLADTFAGREGMLALDYYVLKPNMGKAGDHFRQVHTMLEIFEHYFGPYPFPRDGYALVETPYWGMEHQGAIAYGNNFRNNAFGFDFIIVHESAHEWWGNSISCGDHAELWIHEAFATYAEMLFVEKTLGKEKALEYLSAWKARVVNKQPIIGPAGVNYHLGQDGDMYFKGALMLHTLRTITGDDSIWFHALYRLAEDHKISIVSTEDIIRHFTAYTGKDLRPLFEQYLRFSSPPRLQVKFEETKHELKISYRWAADVPTFAMPVKMTGPSGSLERVYPGEEWQTLTLRNMKVKDFRVDDVNEYFLVE